MARSKSVRILPSKESTARARQIRRESHRRHHAAMETLEQRLLLAQVTWTGGGDARNWTDVNNWSGHAVPGPADDVTINLAGSPTIQIASGTQSVHSVSSSDPLTISGGSLSVAASSSLSGGLTMTGGSITATGSGTSLSVTGTTTVTTGSLFAQNGATVSLPQLSSYTEGVGTQPTLQSSGAG